VLHKKVMSVILPIAFLAGSVALVATIPSGGSATGPVFEGPKGVEGPTGALTQSTTGPTGDAGMLGEMGLPNPNATQVGLTGATGPAGVIGTQGNIGATGPTGGAYTYAVVQVFLNADGVPIPPPSQQPNPQTTVIMYGPYCDTYTGPLGLLFNFSFNLDNTVPVPPPSAILTISANLPQTPRNLVPWPVSITLTHPSSLAAGMQITAAASASNASIIEIFKTSPTGGATVPLRVEDLASGTTPGFFDFGYFALVAYFPTV
jgi:hypothetical protein